MALLQRLRFIPVKMLGLINIMKQTLKLSTAIKKALKSEDFEEFKSFKVKRGACYGKAKISILHVAIKYSSRLKFIKHCIYKFKANPKTKCVKSGSTALHYAAKYGKVAFVNFLVSKCGLDVNEADKKSRSPILIAAKYNQKSTFELLLKLGADIKKVDKRNWGVTHWASRNGNLDLLKYALQSGASCKVLTRSFESCVHLAAWSGNMELFQYLVSISESVVRCSKKGTILHYAAGNWEVIDWILRNNFLGNLPKLSVLLDIEAPLELIWDYCVWELNLGLVFLYDRDDIFERMLKYIKDLDPQVTTNYRVGPKCLELLVSFRAWKKYKALLFLYKNDRSTKETLGKLPYPLLKELCDYI